VLCACGGVDMLVYSNLSVSLRIFTKLHMNIIPLEDTLTLLVSCNRQGLVHLTEGHEQMYGNKYREKY
jgi:hypothetical protein